MNNSTSEKSILCIDDDPAMHALLKGQLELSGFQSLHATSGAEAFGLLNKNRIDLVILDINMPSMDGFQILRQLKEDNRTKQLPVIFLSSLSREHLKVKGLESGADDFVVKPFTGPELMARIKAVLRRNEPKSKPQGVIQGSVEDLGLFELLHMLSFSGKSSVITFPEMEGELVAADGALLSARQGIWRGKEALLRLFFLAKGSFHIVNELKEVQDDEELGGIESLLLYTASVMDEMEEKVRSVMPEGCKLSLMAGGDEYPELDRLKDAFPMTPQALILSMYGELEVNLKKILAAFRQKKIGIAE